MSRGAMFYASRTRIDRCYKLSILIHRVLNSQRNPATGHSVDGNRRTYTSFTVCCAFLYECRIAGYIVTKSMHYARKMEIYETDKLK